MNKCVFPGSFNPFTIGHLNVIEKGLKHFDKVIVAVADMTYKDDAVSAADRAKIVKKSLEGVDNIEVVCFDGYLTDFLSSIGVFTILRGIRDEADKAYEDNLMSIYTEMNPNIKMFYVDADYCHISSSVLRKIAYEGGCLDGFAVPSSAELIRQLYGKNECK